MSIPPVSPQDIAHLLRDKYQDDPTADLTKDIERLAEGEPLAYVIGWIPFLGLKVELDSHPLIPRPETEWWTEALCAHLNTRYKDEAFTFLDLCAGSGAIGLAVLKRCPRAEVTFGEIDPNHILQIQRNIEANNLDATRAHLALSDVFDAVTTGPFDIVATNPPYIPSDRELDPSVLYFEPKEALFSGDDGLDLIRKISRVAPYHLKPMSELWVECDMTHADEVQILLLAGGAKTTTIHNDLYGRPRLVVGYYA